MSASLLSIVMLGAIFYVKQAGSLTGERGFEFDLILLASCLVVIVAGPGKSFYLTCDKEDSALVALIT